MLLFYPTPLGLFCDRWKTCSVTVLSIKFSLFRMRCVQFHAMKDHSHLSHSHPPSLSSSWWAAAQSLSVSQLLEEEETQGREGEGREGEDYGEFSLKKSWQRAGAASCLFLSSPAVHTEYSNRKKLVINQTSGLHHRRRDAYLQIMLDVKGRKRSFVCIDIVIFQTGSGILLIFSHPGSIHNC